MSEKAFRLPDIGEGTAEAELVAWHVAVGDDVVEDQPLCDVMTDKATVEVTAPFGGKVIDRVGSPGEMLPVGSVILRFETEVAGDAEPQGSAPIDKETPAVASAGEPVAGVAAEPSRRVLASPAVRKRAADLGLDLHALVGSGQGGRIRHTDIDVYLAYTSGQQAKGTDLPKATPATKAEFYVPQTAGDYEEVPVIGLRRRISERMQDTKRRIPHFSYVEEVDVTALEQLRAHLNANRRDGQPKLTLLPFLIRALVHVLPEFPQLNALYDDQAGVVRRYRPVNAGIATQTPQGLVVTVLRDAAQHDLWNTASELLRLSDLARSGRAQASDLTESTITITSLGAMGGIATTPIINSPEVAIVGVNKVVERPIVDNGQIRIAKLMNLSSSFDHRVVDGWDAASFIQRLKAQLEMPALLFMEGR